jgi:hypothetical protein
MASTFIAILGTVLAAGAPSRPAGPGLEDDPFARVARAVGDRLVMVQVVVPGEKGGEKVVLSQPGIATGPRHVITISPRLQDRLSAKGAAGCIVSRGGAPGGARRIEGKLVQIDPQTGLAVLQADDLKGPAAAGGPPPVLSKDDPVFVVEAGPDGRFTIRRGQVLQARASIDQGRGKNPLILVQLQERDSPGRGSIRWDDDLVTIAGSFLADAQGGFLGLVTPPALDGGAPVPAAPEAGPPAGATPGARPAIPAPSFAPRAPDPERPQLKDDEVLVLPAEVARFVAESLERGKQPSRGYLGASFREASGAPEEVIRLGAARPAVRVEKVYPGGPADAGGLRSGDWLVAISEKKEVTYSDVIRFSELVEYGGQGKTVPFVVAREMGGRWQLCKLKVVVGWR